MQQVFDIKIAKSVSSYLIFINMFFLCLFSITVNANSKTSGQHEIKKINSYSQLSISKVVYRDNVLTVAGDTDLPDHSILQIKITPENGAAKYSVFAKTPVENKKYVFEVEIPQKPELYQGPYKIVVSFILDMQSDLNVLHLLGNGAENLSGKLVVKEPITDYRTLQCSVTKPLFTLQMQKYSLDDPKKFIHNTPKYVLVFFLTKWSESDWKGMLEYSYAPWVKNTKKSVDLLKSWFGPIKLVGVNFLETRISNALMTEYKLELFYMNQKEKNINNESISVKVIKDNEGRWGVFPVSIIDQHAIFDMDYK